MPASNARAKLLFCQFKPIAYLSLPSPSPSPSPSSLLKVAGDTLDCHLGLIVNYLKRMHEVQQLISKGLRDECI